MWIAPLPGSGDDVVEELEGNEVSAGFAIRALRPRAMSLATGGTYSPWPDAVARADGALGTDDATLAAVATAFGRLSMIWQTVLWHRLVDREPAASIAATIGRTPAEVVAVESAAERGLFETYLAVEMETEGLVAPGPSTRNDVTVTADSPPSPTSPRSCAPGVPASTPSNAVLGLPPPSPGRWSSSPAMPLRRAA